VWAMRDAETDELVGEVAPKLGRVRTAQGTQVAEVWGAWGDYGEIPGTSISREAALRTLAARHQTDRAGKGASSTGSADVTAAHFQGKRIKLNNPLRKGYSVATVKANVADMLKAGHPEPQAVAAALAGARAAYRARHKTGGFPAHLQTVRERAGHRRAARKSSPPKGRTPRARKARAS